MYQLFPVQYLVLHGLLKGYACESLFSNLGAVEMPYHSVAGLCLGAQAIVHKQIVLPSLLLLLLLG